MGEVVDHFGRCGGSLAMAGLGIHSVEKNGTFF